MTAAFDGAGWNPGARRPWGALSPPPLNTGLARASPREHRRHPGHLGVRGERDDHPVRPPLGTRSLRPASAARIAAAARSQPVPEALTPVTAPSSPTVMRPESTPCPCRGPLASRRAAAPCGRRICPEAFIAACAAGGPTSAERTAAGARIARPGQEAAGGSASGNRARRSRPRSGRRPPPTSRPEATRPPHPQAGPLRRTPHPLPLTRRHAPPGEPATARCAMPARPATPAAGGAGVSGAPASATRPRARVRGGEVELDGDLQFARPGQLGAPARRPEAPAVSRRTPGRRARARRAPPRPRGAARCAESRARGVPPPISTIR